MNRGMAQAFITWRDNAADQAEQREMASKALAFFMNRGMAQAFVTWRDNAADLAESRQSAGKALRFFMNRELGRAFAAFRDNAVEQVEQREMASRALAFFMNRGMAQAFVTWRDNAAELAESRQSAGKALRFFMNRELGRAFVAFRENAAEQAEKREMLSKALAFFMYRELAQAFHGFLENVHEQQEKRDKLQRAVARFRNRHVAAAFASFKINVELEQEARGRLVKAAAYFQNMYLGRAFNTWVEAYHVLSAERERLTKAVAFFMNRELSRAFVAFRENATEQRENRDRAKKALGFFMNRELARGFVAFRDNAAAQAESRSNASKALKFFMNRELARAFVAFRDNVAEQVEEREKLTFALAFLMHRELAQAFNGFRDNVYEQQEKRELIQRAVSKFQNRHLAGAFEGFRTNVDLQIEARERLSKSASYFRNIFLAKAWRTWIEVHAVELERKHKIMAFVAARLGKGVELFFAEWRDVVVWEIYSRDALNRAMQKMRNRELSSAWERWVEYVEMIVNVRKAVLNFKNAAVRKAWAKWREHITAIHILRAITHREQHLLEDSFSRLRAWARQSIDLKFKLERAATFAFGSTLLKTFRQWQRYSHMIVKMKWAMADRNTRVLQSSLVEWKEAAAMQKLLNMKGGFLHSFTVEGQARHKLKYWLLLSRAKKHFQGMYFREAFNLWRAKYTVNFQRQEKLRHAVECLTYGSVRRVFSAWHFAIVQRTIYLQKQMAIQEALWIGDQTIRKRKLELITAVFTAWNLRRIVYLKVRQHLLNKVSLSIEQALGSWKAYIERRAYKESRATMALDFFAVTSLRFYLLRWQDQCRLSEESLAKKLSVAVGFFSDKKFSWCLYTWQRYVDQQYERREKFEQLMLLVLYFMEKNAEKLFFSKWMDFMKLRSKKYMKAEGAVRHFQEKTVRGAYMRWASYVRAMTTNVSGFNATTPTLSRVPRTTKSNRTLMRRMQYMVGNTEVQLGSDEEEEVTKGMAEVSSAVAEAKERRDKMQPFFQLARAPFQTPQEKLSEEDEGDNYRTPTWGNRERARGFPGSSRGTAGSRRGGGPGSTGGTGTAGRRFPRETPSGLDSAARTPRFRSWGD